MLLDLGLYESSVRFSMETDDGIGPLKTVNLLLRFMFSGLKTLGYLAKDEFISLQRARDLTAQVRSGKAQT